MMLPIVRRLDNLGRFETILDVSVLGSSSHRCLVTLDSDGVRKAIFSASVSIRFSYFSESARVTRDQVINNAPETRHASGVTLPVTK